MDIRGPLYINNFLMFFTYEFKWDFLIYSTILFSGWLYQLECTRVGECLSYVTLFSTEYNEFYNIGSQLRLGHVLIYSSLILWNVKNWKTTWITKIFYELDIWAINFLYFRKYSLILFPLKCLGLRIISI